MRKPTYIGGVLIITLIFSWADVVQKKWQRDEARKDLAEAQARLDEFYDPSDKVVVLNGLKMKAVQGLGDPDNGYLVLKYSRETFSHLCHAYILPSWQKLERVGNEFACPVFPSRR